MNVLLVFLFTISAHAVEMPAQESIWDVRNQTWIQLSDLAAQIHAGDIVVVGEQHAVDESLSAQVHHGNQLRLMQEIGKTSKISLGMEFFNYTDQSTIDSYLDGELSESKFLSAISWGSSAYSMYRRQVQAPRSLRGHTYGLNIPRAITGKIGKSGRDSLDDSEKALLPPIWERGSDPYFERFTEVMNGHVTGEKLENYFWAHSLWDDTMAWQAVANARADEVFMIIVGEFHAEFGHGLPARLQRHGARSVKTVIQSEIVDFTPEALEAETRIHDKYGLRADYIWVYSLPGTRRVPSRSRLQGLGIFGPDFH